jgi:hypothetical protein
MLSSFSSIIQCEQVIMKNMIIQCDQVMRENMIIQCDQVIRGALSAAKYMDE